MARAELLDQQTSAATRLGYCLQGFVTRCLRRAGIRDPIRENFAYRQGVIRPDLLIGPVDAPRGSVHVTSSDRRNSFQMKKWRYVCELFQLKSFCPAVHSVNLFWGTPALYQPGDVALLRLLFDSTIDLRDDPEARRIYDEAKRRCVREQPNALAAELFESADAAFARTLAEAVAAVLRTPAREANRLLWQEAATRRPGVNRLPDGRRSRWLPLLLRALLLNDDELASLKTFCSGKGEPPPLAVELGVVVPETGIVPGWFVDPGFRGACLSGRVELFRSDALTHARRAPLLREARDARTAEWIPPLYRLLTEGPSAAAARAMLRLGDEHPRLVVIDGLVGRFDVSVNSLEPYWDHASCPIPVRNPVVNLANRTPHVAAALAPGNRERLTRGILHLWRQLHDWKPGPARTLDEFRQAIQRYRRKCLFQQKLLEVAPFAVRRTFAALGWEEQGKQRFTFRSSQDGVAVACEFEFTFQRDGQRVLLRSLYGDTGADHKAEENAGKLFLLPFELRDGRFVSRAVQGTPVFVPEGKWSPEQLDLLASAGWQVVGLEDLPAFLAGVRDRRR
jgi:hypothetical protein